ncbi:SDR family NAD(P)-dependent oxidoreductase [Clostridiales bacterium COT073_COT-073]|nr:SDR family NAD(P)-dependent oxidoreductase [Clostridiales bacterium COT073_COT-073]
MDRAKLRKSKKGQGKQIVLIAGATGGIGSELAQIYASRSAKLILMGRNKEKLLELQSRLNQRRNVSIECLDFRNLSAVQQTFKKCYADLVINCVGIGEMADFHKISAETETEMMQVNYLAPALMIKQLIRHFAERPIRVVNICSLTSLIPHPFLAGYSASKAALYSYLMALSGELKVRRAKLRIFTYLPGPTQTDFFPEELQANIGGSKMQMSVKEVAEKIAEYIETEKEIAIIGKRNQMVYRLLNILPLSWRIWLLAIILKRGVGE